jgi:NTE family protein
MNRKRIAIACQGGGSQCAFIAGALKALFAQDVHRRFEIVGLSGTSGGAITAALAWVGLLKQAQGDKSAIEDRIIAFWHGLSAQTPQEMIFDKMSVQLLRLVKTGLVPSVESSPSSLQFRFWSQAASLLLSRPAFTDLRALLLEHFDFDELPSLVEPDSPVLLVGAADVLDGNFKVFSSEHGEIRVESLLASAAIPNLFPAVWVDGHAYWDGIFSSNPPVVGFLQRPLIGKHARPDEIWILQVNPSRFQAVPENASEIYDRRNHLAGNLSLRHELQLVEMVNLLLEQGALTDEFRARFGLDTSEPIKVRFIRMSEELLRDLDYPSKLSRQPQHIARLIADGEAQASAFLAELGEMHRPADFNGEEVRVQSH